MILYRVTYRGNNSGGYFWTSEEDGDALREAGWLVGPHGVLDNPFEYAALMVLAADEMQALKEAIASWSEAIGMDPHAVGCECCGPPHSFEAVTVDEWLSDHTIFSTGEVDEDMKPFDYREDVD